MIEGLLTSAATFFATIGPVEAAVLFATLTPTTDRTARAAIARRASLIALGVRLGWIAAYPDGVADVAIFPQSTTAPVATPVVTNTGAKSLRSLVFRGPDDNSNPSAYTIAGDPITIADGVYIRSRSPSGQSGCASADSSRRRNMPWIRWMAAGSK